MEKLFAYYHGMFGFFNKKCIFSRLGVTYNNLLTDRFNYLNQFSQWNVEKFNDNLPKINAKLSYYDICINKANEIIKKHPDGIAIAYSGGVDSLGIVASLFLAGYNPENIHVIGNQYSVVECPFAIDFFKKNNIKITIAQKEFVSHFDNIKEDIILTGHCNDQFFHVGKVYENPNLQLTNIKDSLMSLYKDNKIEDYLEFDLGIINEYSKLVNWEVKDLFDLSVLINFGCRYKLIEKHLAFHFQNSKTRYKFYNFYDNQDFQDWAITNKEENKFNYKKSLNNPLFYKKPLKDLIIKVFDDEKYINTKTKEGSWDKKVKELSSKKAMPFIFGIWDKNGITVKWLNPKINNSKSNSNKAFFRFFRNYLRKEYIDERVFCL